MSIAYPEIRNAVYKRYQLDWMKSHKVFPDSFCRLADEWERIVREEGINPSQDEGFDFESYVFDTGFGSGSIWVCYDEFLSAEYQDEAYVEALLEDEPELFRLYLLDIEANFD